MVVASLCVSIHKFYFICHSTESVDWIVWIQLTILHFAIKLLKSSFFLFSFSQRVVSTMQISHSVRNKKYEFILCTIIDRKQPKKLLMQTWISRRNGTRTSSQIHMCTWWVKYGMTKLFKKCIGERIVKSSRNFNREQNEYHSSIFSCAQLHHIL